MRICPTHKEPLIQRPETRQSPEQLWCGTWFDCPYCGYSELDKSEELKAQLAEQRAAKEARLF